MPEIVNKNPLNATGSKPVNTHSTFSPNYSRYDTHRFGLNTPHFVMGATGDDNISMRCTADVDTYTLKAPMMQPVKRNMDYFQIPLRALLPNGAELLITNPRQGDDVQAERVNGVIRVADFITITRRLAGTPQFTDILHQSFTPSGNTDNDRSFMYTVSWILYFYQMGKNLFSKAALPAYLGYAWYDLYKAYFRVKDDPNSADYDVEWDFDTFFENMFEMIQYVIDENPSQHRLHFVSKTLSVTDQTGDSVGSPTWINSENFYVYPASAKGAQMSLSNNGTLKDFVRMLDETNEFWYLAMDEVIKDTDVLSIAPSGIWTPVLGQSTFTPVEHLAAWYFDIVLGTTLDIGNVGNTVAVTGVNDHQNILRCAAYQLACAEFYTNDKVDNIYSAKLYLDNLWELACMADYNLDRYYVINGVSIRYDAIAGQVFGGLSYVYIQPTFNNPSLLATDALCFWAYLHNLFALTRSLKYEDYFVGARKYPLAVGDVSVGVDTGTNTIDIVDVTKKIQVQRFLNQVNRIGRKFSEYMKGIFGDTPVKDMHEPIFLGHVSDTFGAEETNNTGADQLDKPQTVTSKLRNNSSRYGFKVHCGEQSIIIGITNYDIVRVYPGITDRENLHVDRFDMFNPFMQFVGDQEIKRSELRPSVSGNFGYTGRYMEYKQKVDQCAGGFLAGQLPGFAAILKKDTVPATINSDFIRSHVNELDEFYVSLNGYGLSRVWNFIVRSDNDITAHRPMAFNPSIL